MESTQRASESAEIGLFVLFQSQRLLALTRYAAPVSAIRKRETGVSQPLLSIETGHLQPLQGLAGFAADERDGASRARLSFMACKALWTAPARVMSKRLMVVSIRCATAVLPSCHGDKAIGRAS